MDDAVMQTELEKYRQKHLRYIEQGQKIENLTACPEWEFFEGWLKSAKYKLQKQINSPAFVNDHNGYLDARAAIATLDMIFDGIDKFKKNAATSAQSLSELTNA